MSALSPIKFTLSPFPNPPTVASHLHLHKTAPINVPHSNSTASLFFLFLHFLFFFSDCFHSDALTSDFNSASRPSSQIDSASAPLSFFSPSLLNPPPSRSPDFRHLIGSLVLFTSNWWPLPFLGQFLCWRQTWHVEAALSVFMDCRRWAQFYRYLSGWSSVTFNLRFKSLKVTDQPTADHANMCFLYLFDQILIGDIFSDRSNTKGTKLLNLIWHLFNQYSR